MPTISPQLLPVLMLFASNVFMTFAWYGHLKFKESPLPLVIMVSWGIALSEYTALPQRLAGTASQYSNNAIPQLTMMTSGSGLSFNFRWPYQAKVMNTLEANSISTGNSCGEIVGILFLSGVGR